MYYGGLTWGRRDFSYEGNAWELSPDCTEENLDGADAGSLFSLTHLLGPLEALNLHDVTTFKCPVFLFEGRHDYVTSHTLAEECFHQVQAPEKKSYGLRIPHTWSRKSNQDASSSTSLRTYVL